MQRLLARAHSINDDAASTERNRHRIRARFGMSADLADDLSASGIMPLGETWIYAAGGLSGAVKSGQGSRRYDGLLQDHERDTAEDQVDADGDPPIADIEFRPQLPTVVKLSAAPKRR